MEEERRVKVGRKLGGACLSKWLGWFSMIKPTWWESVFVSRKRNVGIIHSLGPSLLLIP